ncbi:MAG: hypothetical protein K0U93_20485, partial [Gammaproteobacteria bacterium]|nr:hypothetical protein [Gammaproteobacteria bacterium]
PAAPCRHATYSEAKALISFADDIGMTDETPTKVRPFNDLFEGLPGSPFTAQPEPSVRAPQELPIEPETLSETGPDSANDALVLAFRDKRAQFVSMQRRMYTEFQALREENLRLAGENRRLKQLAGKYKRLLEDR